MLTEKEDFSKKFKSFAKTHKMALVANRGDHELKRGIKRNLVKAFRNSVFKLGGIQKILFAALALLKRLSLNLNLTFPTVLRYGYMFKTKLITILSCVLQFRYLLKKRKLTSIILVLSAFFVFNIFLLNSIGGQLLYKTSLQSHGTIETIGVAAYKDSSCITLISDVNWGTLTPGLSSTNTIYVRNEGNSDLTLSLDTTNWNPINTRDYMTLSWNYIGQTITQNQVVQITLTLSVSQNINGIDSFNFDIIILGTN